MNKRQKFKKYPRPTTFSQRALMIETYLKTYDIKQVCKKTKVSKNTFQIWYSRYLNQGIGGIIRPKKPIRKNLGRVPEEYSQRAIELKKKNPKWGRRTIAAVIRDEYNSKKIISPSGVQKVLERAGLWNKKNKPKITH